MPSADSSRSRVLSYPALALLVLAGIGLSYFFVPSQREMLDRIHRDELSAHVIPLLQQGAQDDAAARAAIDYLNSLPAEKLVSLAHLAKLTPHERLVRLFKTKD